MKYWLFVGLVALFIIACADEGENGNGGEPLVVVSPDSMLENKASENIILDDGAQGVSSTYTLKKNATSMRFTGYKFDTQTPVSGTFDDVDFSFAKTSGSLEDILSGAKVTINTSSVNSANAARDLNFNSAFFNHFSQTITASIVKIDTTNSRIDIDITMNDTTVPSSFSYSVVGTKLTANGLIDVLQFGLLNAIKSLTAVAPHGGITSTIVDLVVEVEFL